MPTKSDLSPVEVANESFPTRFLRTIWQHFSDNPQKIALVNAEDAEDSVSYGEVYVFSRSFGHGDVACAVLPNCWEYAVIFAGVGLRGGALSGANPFYTEHELGNQFRESRAKIVFCVGANLEKVFKATKIVSTVQAVVLVESGRSKKALQNESIGLAGIVRFGQVLRTEPTLFSERTDQPLRGCRPERDLLLLPFSSGTTGTAKGVMISHSNWGTMMNIIVDHFNRYLHPHIGPPYYVTEESDLLLLPFFHCFGFTLLNMTLLNGSTGVVLSKFEQTLFCRTVEQYRIRLLILVPPILVFMAKNAKIDNYDFSHVNVIFSGAAPAGADLCEELKRRFPNLQHICQGYGMTEMSVAIALPVLDKQRMQSAGKLLANLEMKIVDLSSGEEAELGMPGELFVRGPTRMVGYLGRPNETAEIIDGEGWLRTGDIVFVDKDGFINVVDRLKELIKVNGLQVPPSELEDLLLSHPEVQDCAVLGVPDPVSGELPRAFVVRKNRSDISEAQIQQFVKERVVYYKQLKGGVEFVEEVPKRPYHSQQPPCHPCPSSFVFQTHHPHNIACFGWSLLVITCIKHLIFSNCPRAMNSKYASGVKKLLLFILLLFVGFAGGDLAHNPIYRPDKNASVVFHGQIWEDNEVKEYQIEAEVLDEEKPIKEPKIVWETGKWGERHFTLTFKFKEGGETGDPPKKQIEKLKVELFNSMTVKSFREKTSRVNKDIKHTFLLRDVDSNKHYALDLDREKAVDRFETFGEMHEELERRRGKGTDGWVDDDELEVEELMERSDERKKDGWSHTLDGHEEELHEHRLGQMGEGRKKMKEVKDKEDTPHHSEPKGIIQGVVWDEEGLIIEKPFIKLLQHGKDLPDYEVLCNGNGFFEIEVYGEHKGTVEIRYGKDEKHTEGFLEDLDTLYKAAFPDHPEHDHFHGIHRKSDMDRHRKILHLHYKHYGPYMFVYHIYGVVLKLDSKQIPQVIMDTDECVDCPYLQLEYTSDQEHDVHKRVKAEIDHNLDTGEFRITIRNGYGLDPERKRRMDKNYGKLNIIVAANKRELSEGMYRVYTVDVLECVRNFVKQREILFLHVDKDSIYFEKFDIKEAISHKLQFQIRRKSDGQTEGQCQMLSRRPPDGDNDCPWLLFKDKAGNQIPADKHIKQLGFRLAQFTQLVEVSFSPTLINEFFIHIDCGYGSSEPSDEPEVVYHTSFHQIDVVDDSHKNGAFPLLTAPLKMDKVELVELPEKKQLGHRTHRIDGHILNRFTRRQKH
uniref:Luciferase n=1 Tax=Globodera rostochiensis TaxID=31243 RepID=A0A914H434_GLORO